MTEENDEKPDLQDVIASKKLAKADLKAADKAKKAAKAAKKIAKDAEKSLRKIEKQRRKDEANETNIEPAEVSHEAAAGLKKAKPDQAKPDQAKPDQAKPDQAKPKKVKINTAKPDHIRPDRAGAEAMSLGAKLQAVARLARGSLAGQLLKLGLYAGQEQVLFLLEEHGPLALTELAERLDVRAPTITKTVTRMESQGFLTRAISRDDARSIIISLAPEGHNVLKACRDAVADVEGRIFDVLAKADREILAKTLNQVIAHMKQGH